MGKTEVSQGWSPRAEGPAEATNLTSPTLAQRVVVIGEMHGG